MIQLYKNANNYSSTYEELHAKLFAEQKEGIRLIWEYIHMVYQDYDGVVFLRTTNQNLRISKTIRVLQEIWNIAVGRRKSNHWSIQILFRI